MRLRYSCLYTGTAKFCLGLQLFIKEESWTAIFKILVRSLGMVKFSRNGHFQRVATCKEGTFKRAATCKEGTFKPASFIFLPALYSFTFLSQFTNPLEAGCCYCQPFKQKTLKKIFLLKILISTCFSKRADFYGIIGKYFHLLYMVHCSKFTPLFELLLNWCHLKDIIVITLLSTA